MVLFVRGASSLRTKFHDVYGAQATRSAILKMSVLIRTTFLPLVVFSGNAFGHLNRRQIGHLCLVLQNDSLSKLGVLMGYGNQVKSNFAGCNGMGSTVHTLYFC